jgi:hypothetical protein
LTEPPRELAALLRTTKGLTVDDMAIDGSKFKVVNNRDRNFTRAKMQRRMTQIEESVAHLHQLDSADRQEPSLARTTKTSLLSEKIAKLKEEMHRLEALNVRMLATPDQRISLTDPDARSMATSGQNFLFGGPHCRAFPLLPTLRVHWRAAFVGAVFALTGP